MPWSETTVSLLSRLFEKRCKFAAFLHMGHQNRWIFRYLQRFLNKRLDSVTVVSDHGVDTGPVLEEALQLCHSGSSCRSQDLKKSLLAYAEGFYVLYTMGATKKIQKKSSVTSLKPYLSIHTNFDPC